MLRYAGVHVLRFEPRCPSPASLPTLTDTREHNRTRTHAADTRGSACRATHVHVRPWLRKSHFAVIVARWLAGSGQVLVNPHAVDVRRAGSGEVYAAGGRNSLETGPLPSISRLL